MNKNKFTIVGIILTTLVLAGVAIFTAIRLYQTRDTAVAPNVPSSRPAAQVAPTTPPANACSLSFTLLVQTPTPTATSTSTATATATSTAVPQCDSTCNSSADCPSNLTCYKPNGATAGNCRNASCTTASNCFCSTSTPTATATSTSKATVTPTATSAPQCNYSCTSNSGCPSSMICYIPSGATAGNCRNTQCLTETDCLCPNPTSTATTTPTLPEVGTKWPTVIGTGLGIIVILGSLLLAL